MDQKTGNHFGRGLWVADATMSFLSRSLFSANPVYLNRQTLVFWFMFFSSLPFSVILGPGGLTFTWWGCCGLCLWNKPAELDHTFSFCSCLYFCLSGPFKCISFHKFSRQLSAFSLCSSGLLSASWVRSTIYLLTKVSLSPDIILCGWLGLKHYYLPN